jgi:hypothetical protein
MPGMVPDMKPILYLAKAAALSGAAADLQIYPPGRQTLIPSNVDPKKPRKEIEVVIDEATANALEAVRAEYQAKADANEGDAPFFDFNHDDREASAWPKRIYWAGEDPVLGGVRAEVEWSSDGAAAVNGKTFRRFSPAFFEPDANGRITDAPVNMGGLVNRAAFTKIAGLPALAAKLEIELETESPTDPMTPEEITALQEELAASKTKVAELQKQIDDLTVTAKAAAETDAKNTVAMAAKEGRIPAAAEVQAKWVAAIVADPNAKELLLAMAPNPALKVIVTAKAGDPNKPGDEQEKQEEVPEGLTGLAAIIKAKRAPEAKTVVQ